MYAVDVTGHSLAGLDHLFKGEGLAELAREAVHQDVLGTRLYHGIAQQPDDHLQKQRCMTQMYVSCCRYSATKGIAVASSPTITCRDAKGQHMFVSAAAGTAQQNVWCTAADDHLHMYSQQLDVQQQRVRDWSQE